MLPPASSANQALLSEVDGLYPSFLTHSAVMAVGDVLTTHAERWTVLAVTDRVDEALAELASFDLHTVIKAQLEVQLLARSGQNDRTTQAIRAHLAHGVQFPPESKANLGRLALKSGDYEIAGRLLDEGIEHVTAEHMLAAVLTTCTILGRADLEDRTYSRISTLFPDSESLFANKTLRLAKMCQSGGRSTGAAMPSRIGFDELESQIAEALTTSSDDNYAPLLAGMHDRSAQERDLVRMCCALHALNNTKTLKALELALSIENQGLFARQAAWFVLDAIRDLMLTGRVPTKCADVYSAPLAYVIRYVAMHPDDPEARVVLSSLFDVEASGTLGLPMVAFQALERACRQVAVDSREQTATSDASHERCLTFVKAGVEWMATQPAIEVGVTQLPPELQPIGDDAKALLQSLVKMTGYICEHDTDREDVEVAERHVYLACMLARNIPDTVADLKALRLLASRYIQEGQVQKGRDLAELALQLAGNDLKRQRAAWTIFADIYHRVRSPTEALLAIACAYELDQTMTPLDLWWEHSILLRITRDVGMTQVARNLIPACRSLLDGLECREEYERRMEFVELGLRLVESSDSGVDLVSLVADTARHCAIVLSTDEEVLPAVALLGQALGRLTREGGVADPQAREVFEAALETMSPVAAAHIRAISSPTPSVDEVLLLYRRLDRARYADDIPADLSTVVIATRRMLTDCGAGANAELTALAVELLADRGVEPVAGAVVLDAHWPLDFAAGLIVDGLAVLMLAIDEAGSMNCVQVIGADVDVHISTASSATGTYWQQLAKWSESYPFRYGLIDHSDGNNEFFITMEPLAMPLPVASRILVVAEPALQQIPISLVPTDGGFAGASRAIGYAPSLTWFEATRRLPRNGSGRRVAWIPKSEDLANFGTLDALLCRIEPTLEAHDFQVNTDACIPTNFINAQIAVVTAHGGLNAGERFIHCISNEESFMESPLALARALRGVELGML